MYGIVLLSVHFSLLTRKKYNAIIVPDYKEERSVFAVITLNKNTVVLFFGDSITHGGRLESMDGNHIMGHGYQSIIASKLGFDNIENMPKFINKGISGDSISQMYSRLYGDVIINKPDIISILAGINDIGKGIGMPYKMITDKFIRVYQLMLDDIKALLKETKIVICEPFYLELDSFDHPYKNTPYVYCEEYFKPCYIPEDKERLTATRKEITYMQQELKKFAQKNECIYIPLQDEFLKLSKKVPPEYLVWDTVHPTIVGHELIARKWLEVTEQELNRYMYSESCNDNTIK